MRFADIPGLDDTRKLLTEAVRANHSAHAQLFAGAPGSLNLPMALAFATYLHCENRGDDACGSCAACSKSLKYIHPDTHFVFPVGNIQGEEDDDTFKSRILKEWRAFLLEQPFGALDDWTSYYGGEDKQALISREESREIIKTLSLTPFESPYKVMIIWCPELMHPSAANGILKILEEPASHTYFILVSNAADQLLPTTLSRTQIVNIRLLADDELHQWLTMHHQVDSDRIHKILQLADGNLNLALKLLENPEDDNTDFFVEWMRACFNKKYGALVEKAEAYHGMDKIGQRSLMMYGMNMMRESLLYSAGASEINRARGEERTFVERFSAFLDVDKIDLYFRLMNDAAYHLERNGSAKMIFLDLSLKIAGTLKSGT